ncbi:MAG TPA: antibiotic biosynthesis monooxygenase [Polyangiales bacterium]|nr:antibiotic biosynthesis monooxygenase [Polyangiales bacterium]
MTKLGLLVRLKAKPGKEKLVAEFLSGAIGAVQAEEFTPVWFGLAGASGTFYIFDAFDDEGGREQHLAGQVAGALMQQAPELLSEPPHIEKVDVLTSKILKGAVT